MINRNRSAYLFISILTLILWLNSCKGEGELDRDLWIPAPQGTFQVVYQSGENTLQRNQEEFKLNAGDLLIKADRINCGGEVLFMDGQQTWLLLSEGCQILYSGEERGFFLHQGQMSLRTEKEISLETEEFQLDLTGEIMLNLESLQGELQLLQGNLRFLPGGISTKEMDRHVSQMWPSLTPSWTEWKIILPEGRSYQWQMGEFREISRLMNSLFYLKEEEKDEATRLIRQLQEFTAPEGLNLGKTPSILEKSRFILDILSKEPVYFREVKTDPPETLITAGPFQGYGVMELPLREERSQNILYTNRGYRNMTRELSLETPPEQRLLSMQRKSRQSYSISTTPSDAMIYVNDLFAGKGQLVLSQKPGEVINLRVELEGYNTQELVMEEIGQYPENLEIELYKTLQGRFIVGYQSLIGLAYHNGFFITSDIKGQITSIHAKRGLRPWAIQSSNSPNNWSSPVIINDLVYFSGRKTLAAYDPSIREVIGVYTLNYRSLHQYGRRVVALGNTIVLPTADSLIFLSRDLSQTLKVVDIPGGSMMTPLSYNGSLYIASNDGRIHRFNSKGELINSGYSRAFSPVGMSMVVQKNRAYFSDREGLVVCFDLESLEILWETALPELGRQVFRDLQIDGENLYLYSEGYLYRFHSLLGDYLEQWPEPFLTRPVIENGIIYGSTRQDRFTLTDWDSGETLRSLELTAAPSTQVITAEGYAAMGMSNGRILIINQPDQEWTPPEEELTVHVEAPVP